MLNGRRSGVPPSSLRTKLSLSEPSSTNAESFIDTRTSPPALDSDVDRASWPMSSRVPVGRGIEKESAVTSSGRDANPRLAAKLASSNGPRRRGGLPSSTATPASLRTLAENVHRSPTSTSRSR